MERLIESVRKHPCLWKTDIEEYKLISVKEVAWREIVKEADLPDVKEAKILWRKLRDGHRQAISRKKTGQAASTKSWKYEKIMDFLLPTMQNRTRATKVQDGDVTPLNDDLSDSEHHQRADDFVPPKKKPNLTTIKQNEQKRRELRSAERDSPRRQSLFSTSRNTTSSIVENTALEQFFMSMLLTTNSLSETLQIKVQRQLFNIVMEAKEEDIATRSRALSSSPASPAANFVHYIKEDSPS